jgi:hypothetical protein
MAEQLKKIGTTFSGGLISGLGMAFGALIVNELAGMVRHYSETSGRTQEVVDMQ